MTAFDRAVVVRLNRIRSQSGLVPLRSSAELVRSAKSHSDQMVAEGFFSHSDPGGPSFTSRMASFYPIVGFTSWAVGENLFWVRRPIDPAGVVHAWMASPEHRANILDPRWRQVGFALATSPHAPGLYHGYPVLVATLDFGVRSRVPNTET